MISAGIAVKNDQGFMFIKKKGRIADLREVVNNEMLATMELVILVGQLMGLPSKENAHPHQSASGRFTLVHNGVIEKSIPYYNKNTYRVSL